MSFYEKRGQRCPLPTFTPMKAEFCRPNLVQEGRRSAAFTQHGMRLSVVMESWRLPMPNKGRRIQHWSP